MASRRIRSRHASVVMALRSAASAAVACFAVGVALAQSPQGPSTSSAVSPDVRRGEYLARAGDCVACHTVRGGQAYAGGLELATPFGSLITPNITPDRETGLGSWTEEQITDYLGTGNKPDGDVAGGLMMEVIEGSSAGYKDLTKADRQAIAKYLKSIPTIKNKID